MHWPWRGSVWSLGAQGLRPCTGTSCQPHAATRCQAQLLATSSLWSCVPAQCWRLPAPPTDPGTATACIVSAGQTLMDLPHCCYCTQRAPTPVCVARRKCRRCPCHVHQSPLGGHIPALASLPPRVANAVAIACGVRPGSARRPVLDTRRPLRQRQRGLPCRPRQRRNAGEAPLCVTGCRSGAEPLCRLLSLRLCNK